MQSCSSRCLFFSPRHVAGALCALLYAASVSVSMGAPPGVDCVIYKHDFSHDPQWATDQPGRYRWDPASGTYVAETENAQGATTPSRSISRGPQGRNSDSGTASCRSTRSAVRARTGSGSSSAGPMADSSSP